MNKENKNSKLSIKKALYFIGISLCVLIIFLNLFILISGRFYLYKGIYYTYLHGKTAPGIFDKDVFYSSKIKKDPESISWKKSTRTKKISLTAKEIGDLESLQISSFLVLHEDTLLFEKYWGEHTQTSVSNSFSASKTVVALLVGVALQEHAIKNLDEPVGNFIPAFKKGKKKEITIRHLLMMASGLDWEESAKNPLSSNAESYYGSNLYELVCNQNVITKPGVLFNYQSGNSQLLGFIVEKATGKKLSDYAQEKLWSKMGTENDAYWSLDKKDGDEKSFCCLYSTSRDFARIGKLIGNLGNWNGKQLVSREYMIEILKNPKMKTKDGVPNYQYGLHIWTYLGGKYPVYYCRGILGQYIISIPAKKLVIVRSGFKRMEDLKLTDEQKRDKQFVKKNKFKIGQPSDLFQYIAIGERMIQ